MFMQSAAMALGFGSFFQYGKRRVSAMSNEEFNALTPEALTAQLITNINNMIPTVGQSFQQMEQMNVMILDAMAKYFNQAVTYLDQWLKGGFHNFLHNVGAGGDDFTGEDIPDFIPTAGGDTGAQTIPPPPALTPGLNAIDKFVSKWINFSKNTANFTSATVGELRQMLEWISQGKAQKWKQWRTTILQIWEEKTKPPKPKTQAEIDAEIKKQSANDVAKIALMFNQIKFYLGQAVNNTRKDLINKFTGLFHTKVSEFNRFVQQTRKGDGTTYRSLSINAEKSLQQKKIISKF